MLELKELRKRYDSTVALDGASWTAAPGRLTGFLGPNGAGKTTTMRVIFGLAALDSGEVRWNGAPIDEQTRRRFGYMPEERGLYPRMRVRDQLVYFGRLAGLTPSKALDRANGWLDVLGLSERANDRVDHLSHGNQQRVQLAAALVHDPELLVLDEPFSGLDPLAMDTMAQLLTDLAHRGAAVVFSSHQLDLVEDLCEDVVVLDHGRVVLSGVLADLRENASHRYVDLSVRGTAVAWDTLLPGATVTGRGEGSVRFQVERDVDLAALVARAQQAGEVSGLAFQPPTLTELFRTAVGS